MTATGCTTAFGAVWVKPQITETTSTAATTVAVSLKAFDPKTFEAQLRNPSIVIPTPA
jgi:hypothetical protein